MFSFSSPKGALRVMRGKEDLKFQPVMLAEAWARDTKLCTLDRPWSHLSQNWPWCTVGGTRRHIIESMGFRPMDLCPNLAPLIMLLQPSEVSVLIGKTVGAWTAVQYCYEASEWWWIELKFYDCTCYIVGPQLIAAHILSGYYGLGTVHNSLCVVNNLLLLLLSSSPA